MNNSFDFKWLKSQISIQQVLSAYQLDGRLKQKNDTLCGPCPLHGGNNPTAWGDENAHSGGQFEQIKHFHFCSLVFYANGHI